LARNPSRSQPATYKMTPPFSAVLLAAGLSTRMGREKALLAVADGRPLWERQRDVLRAAGAVELLFSVRPAQTWIPRDANFTLVHDAVPGRGPLGGIVAALERAVHPHLAVLAIDLPRMESGWFAALLADCAPGVGAVGRRENFFEPLAAVYPREILPLAREAVTRHDFSLQRLLAAAVAQGLMRVREIAAAGVPWFENWNEPGPAGG
jgi:molybdopterin-guanine dinucleotide biosynthesis protein A